MTDELGRATEHASTRALEDRLDSWKEIASYLKRDVTTVRRWEKREGLPVHRHLHDRRESVYAYTNEIDRWWSDRRTQLVDKTPSSPATAPPRTTAKWMSAAAALALVGMGVGAFFYRWRGVPEDALVPRVVRMSIQPEGAIVDLAFSPDGRSLAFVAESKDGGKIWIRTLDSSTPRALPGTNGADGSVFWSPDGRYVAFGAGAKLKKVAVMGGPVHVLCDAPAVIGGTWNRDDVLVFAPATRTALFRVPASGGEPVAVTTVDTSLGHNTHRWPHFLPDGRRFLYFARGNKAEYNGIYAGSLDSKAVSRVTSVGSQAAYSPSGYLVFVRDRALLAQPFDPSALKETGEPIQVLDDVRYHAASSYAWFAISEHGELAYQTSSATPRSRLVWYDRRGRSIQRADAIQDSEDPSLSPDGSRVAISRSDGPSGDIWLVDRVKGSSRVTSDASADIMPVWSPDGASIVFASNRDGPSDLYRISSSGSGSAEAVVRSAAVKHPSDWSRAAGVIVYDSNDPATGIDIWTVPTQPDATPEAFLRTPFSEGFGRLSPDGRLMAYTSNESGTDEIYVRPFPAAAPKWKVSTSGGTEPRWRGDGKELFYLSGSKLMTVQVQTSPAFHTSLPTALFEAQPSRNSEWSYDVARDGQSFVFTVRSDDPVPPAINLVLNWPGAISSTIR